MDDFRVRAQRFLDDLRAIAADSEWQRRDPEALREISNLAAEVEGGLVEFISLQAIQQWKRRADDIAAQATDGKLRAQIRVRATGLVNTFKPA